MVEKKEQWPEHPKSEITSATTMKFFGQERPVGYTEKSNNCIHAEIHAGPDSQTSCLEFPFIRRAAF